MSLATTAQLMNVTGHFDYILDGRAYGWAFAPAHPGKRLTIEIVANGEVVAHGRAERFREDLPSAGIGDGYHLFDLPLSHELFDGQIHSLIARDAETGTVLNGGPYDFGPEQREPGYPQISRAQGLQLLAEWLTQPRYQAFADRLDKFAQAYRLASRLQETGQLLDARTAWLTINQALGENPIGYCKLGECLMLEEQPADALEAFRTAAGSDLRLHWAHLGMANALSALGQFDEAEEALQVAIALQPQDQLLKERLSHLREHTLPRRIDTLVAQGKRDEAIALLKTLLFRNPDDSLALYHLGNLLLTSDQETHDASLPGLAQLHELRKTQRILDALLDDIEQRQTMEVGQ